MPGNAIIVQLTDGLSESLLRMDRAARSKALRIVMGAAVAVVMVGHFKDLDAARHRNETGIRFYGNAAAAVQRPQVSGDEVMIAVTQDGIAQRYYGGTIVAGSNGSGKKWITIPAIPAALGRTAGSFSNLRFVFFRPDLAALVANDPQKAKFRGSPGATKERGARLVPREDGRLPVVFWLKPSVNQKPDPSVIPDEETLAAAAYQEGSEYLENTLNDTGGNAA